MLICGYWLYWLVGWLVGWLVDAPCGSLVRPVVTNPNSSPYRSRGGEWCGALELSSVAPLEFQDFRIGANLCISYKLHILRISYVLSVRNMCVLWRMRIVHIIDSHVRIRLWHIGTPYIPYLSTTGGPTNPHITGRQLKYVIIALCSIYITDRKSVV